jgi:hypothetical protein
MSFLICTLQVINQFAIGTSHIRHVAIEERWLNDPAQPHAPGISHGAAFGQVFERVLKERKEIVLGVLKNAKAHGHPVVSHGGRSPRSPSVSDIGRESADRFDGKLPILITNPSHHLGVTRGDYLLTIPGNTNALKSHVRKASKAPLNVLRKAVNTMQRMGKDAAVSTATASFAVGSSV